MTKINLHHRLQPLAILLLLAFLTSCSIKLIYNNLDWVLASMIEDYVTLSSEQETDVDLHVEEFLKWHKETQLQAYANDLRTMKSLMTSTTMNDGYAEQMFTMFIGHWQTLKENVAPRMADLFLALKEDQITDLLVILEAENKEIDEEFKDTTREERLEKGGDNMVDNFEEWFGTLTQEQETMLRAWPERFKPLHHERMKFRKNWQAGLNAVLNSDISKEQKRTRLMDMIINPEQFQTTEHKERLVYNTKQIKELLLTLDPLVLNEQRMFMAERLDYFIKNFDELAAEAEEDKES